MEKENIEKIIFGILIACGIAYAYYTFVFAKQMENINRISVEVLEKENKKKELEKTKNNFEASKNQLREMEKEIAKTEEIIPEIDDTRQFCIDLYYYTKAHNLKTPNEGVVSKERQKNDKGGHEKQIINVSVTGQSKEVIGFINYIKSLPKKVNISSCSIKILKTEEWSADLKLDIFFISKIKGNK